LESSKTYAINFFSVTDENGLQKLKLRVELTSVKLCGMHWILNKFKL